MPNVSRNLRKMMKLKKVSLVQISQATGVARSTVGEWVSGRSPRLGPEIALVAKFLGVTLEDLIQTAGTRPGGGNDLNVDGAPRELLAACVPVTHGIEGEYLISVRRIKPTADVETSNSDRKIRDEESQE